MNTPEIERTNAGPFRSGANTGRTMKALVYHGPGKRAWEEKPRPAIKDAADAIVRMTTSTICGTDLHILNGDLPSVMDAFSGTKALASSKTSDPASRAFARVTRS